MRFLKNKITKAKVAKVAKGRPFQRKDFTSPKAQLTDSDTTQQTSETSSPNSFDYKKQKERPSSAIQVSTRILKNKLARAQAIRTETLDRSLSFTSMDSQLTDITPQTSDYKKQKERPSDTTKNVVINFTKGISSFGISILARPYLQDLLKQEKHVSDDECINYLERAKNISGSIDSFRDLLLFKEEDGPKVRALKRVFKELSVVFIKYFSVNWIIHGRIKEKLVYLKYRGKMLRRVQNPEVFIYIKKRDSEYNKKNTPQ